MNFLQNKFTKISLASLVSNLRQRLVNKKSLLLVGIGVLFLLLILVTAFTKKKTPTQIPTPTPVPPGDLVLLDTSPQSGKSQQLHLTTAIRFHFNSPLILSSSNVTVEPTVPIIIESDNTNSSYLLVRPKETWKYGVKYKVAIHKGLKSILNKEIKDNISYEFEFERPTDIMSY